MPASALTTLDPRIVAVVTAITIVLLVWSLWDLSRPQRRVVGNKWIWLVVILVVGLPGQILYLSFGRRRGPSAPPAG